MDNTRFAPMVQALTNAGYTGPQFGTPEMRAARAAGQTPFKDWFSSLPPDQRQGLFAGGALGSGFPGLGGRFDFGGGPQGGSGNMGPRTDRPNRDTLTPGGFPVPGNTGIVPPHMGGSPVPMPPIQGGPGPVPGGPNMGHMGPGSGLAPPYQPGWPSPPVGMGGGFAGGWQPSGAGIPHQSLPPRPMPGPMLPGRPRNQLPQQPGMGVTLPGYPTPNIPPGG